MSKNEFKTTDVNCLLTDGGMGDLVAALVAVDYINKEYKHVRLHVWVPDYALQFTMAALPGVKVSNFTTAKKQYDMKKPGKNTRWDGRVSPMKIHLVDYAFQVLTDEQPDITKKNYLQLNLERIDVKRFELPNKYVVLTTGFTAPNREFLPQYINEIATYIKSKGYDIVFLGKKQSYTGSKHIIKGTFKEEINYDIGLNLIDKTSLLEAAKVIKQSSCIVGLDNGLLHIAGCTEVPIVGGFTNCDPKTRMPFRHNELGWNFYPVVPPEDLGCRFCQTRLNFVYGHAFHECFYKNYDCIKLLESKLYIEQLERIL